MGAMREADVTFFNRRLERLAGVSTLPDGPAPHPAVVLCQGLSGLKHLVLPAIASALADAGFASLRFDYAGCGESEGESGWVDPLDRVADALHALAFLRAHPEVDRDRVGVYGHSYGGPVAIESAARDGRLRAVVAVSGPGAGLDLLRAPRASWDWIAFRRGLDAERERIATTGTRRRVEVSEILPFSPEFLAAYRTLTAAQGGTSAMAGAPQASTRYLASADAMLGLRPDDAARHLGGTALLLVHGADDDVAPIETIEPILANATGPKALVQVPGANHNDLDAGPGLARAIDAATRWFTDHMR